MLPWLHQASVRYASSPARLPTNGKIWVLKMPAKRRHTQRLVLGERPCGRWDIQKHRSRSHSVLQRRVFAIAITLLVLEIRLPEPIPATLEPFERIARSEP